MELTSQESQTLKQAPHVQNIPQTQQTKLQEPKAQPQKQYYFQTQTKRLKEYYLKPENRQKIISRKILFSNSPGIVRYIGELVHEGAQKNNELWIGVEWEETNRGKHNGTVKGHKYFQCSPNQGSMVKYQKIQFGYKLQTALFKRYFRSEQMHHARNIYQELKNYKKQLTKSDQLQNSTTVNDNKFKNTQQKSEKPENTQQKIDQPQNKEVIVQKKRKLHKIEYDADAYFDSLKKTKKIMVQFVGFDQIWTKINNLDKIQSISLPDCRICDLGAKGHLNQIFKNLRLLSLQDNLLSHYNQIYQLGSQLPQLEQLSLTNNRLAQPELSFEEMKQIQFVGHNTSIQLPEFKPLFPKLKILILINTGLSWKILFKIIKAFNKLKQLVLCRNDLTDYENIDKNKLDCLEQLNFLNLQATKLKDFKNVMVFKDLPKLQKLTLNHNPIQQFGREINGFESVKALSIQNCEIRKPVVIYQISNFKNVQNLNFRHNPLNEIMGSAYVRLRSIAQFQKLTIINGAPLKKYQRKDSQIYYMRQTFKEYFVLKNRPDYDYDFEDFCKWCIQFHPNIQLFIKRFGNPYEVEQKKQIKDIIKNQVKQTQIKKGTGMVKVKIHYEQLGSTDERKIPLTWTLANLKNFFAKTIKIPSGNQQVIHKNESEGRQEQMGQDHKALSFYNICQQSTLIVKRKDHKGGISFIV